MTNLIDGTLVTLTSSPCPNPSLDDLDGLSIGVVSQDLIRAMNTFIKGQTPISKLIKGEITTMKSRNMATMASWLLSTFDVHDFFWLGKININHERKSKINSNNLKTIRDLKVILKEEFKAKVRKILEL
jgi:hypothetical protein